MTREEAAAKITKLRDGGAVHGEAFDMAIAALREPVLDENGLVRCGCGGVTEQTDFHDGFFPHSKVECLECGIEIMRAGNIIAEAHDEAKMAWNTAMGWKGGAE